MKPCRVTQLDDTHIFRAALVSALRERAAVWEKQARLAAASDARTLFSECAARRAECVAMALVIERGEWPQTHKGETE